MDSIPSNTKQRLAQLYRERMPGKLKLCALLLQQAQRNRWAKATTDRLHLEIQRLLRGATNFGMEEIQNTLSEIKKTLEQALQEGVFPDEDATRQLRVQLLRLAGEPAELRHEDVEGATKEAQETTRANHSFDDHEPAPEEAEQEEISQALVDALLPHPERPVLLQWSSGSQEKIREALRLFGYNVVNFDGHFEHLEAMLAQASPMLAVLPLPKTDEDVEKHATIAKHAPCDFLYYASVDTLENRLRCVRAGGSQFAISPLDEYQLLSFLENANGEAEEDPLRVLVVEDSRSQGLFCKRTLEKVGMAAEWIAEPGELIDTVHRFEPELILMDMQLPGCNGMELAQVLQQLPDTKTIPVIYASAEEDPMKREQALQTAGEGFLDKPVQADALVKAVRHRALRYRLTRSVRHTDELTRLPNRSSFLRDLQAAASRTLRDGVGFTLVLLDIRGLDAIRQSKGEAGAERLIQTLAHLLRQRTRCSDHLARLADGRFALMLYDCPKENAERLLGAVSELWNKVRHALLLTDESYLAWGIAEFTDGDAHDCYQQALGSLVSRPHRPPTSIRPPKT